MKNCKPHETEIYAWQVLEALLDLARTDRHATAGLLASLTGIPLKALNALLEELDELGLVDAERCRLTMPGLVLAACAQGDQSRLVDRAA
jgi:DNA-binding IscR family transcriptional regulator